MLALLCDTCKRPIEHEGYELTLMPGAIVSGPAEFTRFSTGGSGVISAYMCRRCGERIAAILRHKLQDPCPTCEVAPMQEGDRRAEEEKPLRRYVA
jgi:hypothetical protein